MVSTPVERGDRETRRTVSVALAANVVIVVTKIAAAAVTGSPALISEAAHSVADTVNELLLLAALARSGRQADELHPFGYGKARYFYALLAAVGIFVTGACFSFYQGVRAFSATEVETSFYPLAYAVLAVSVAADGTSLVRASRQALSQVPPGPHRVRRLVRAERDPTLSTVLAEDSTAVTGVALAAAGLAAHQLTGDGRYEAWAALAIAALLAMTAVRLGRAAEGLVIGQAAPGALVRDAYLTLDERPEVDTILQFLTMRMGPDDILLAARIDLADGMDSDGVEAACGRVKSAMTDAYPQLSQIFLDITDATQDDRVRSAARRHAVQASGGQREKR